MPHYDHVDQLSGMLASIVDQGVPLVVVDDASPEAEWRRLQSRLQATVPGALVLRHAQNRGKGAAVITGLKAAAAAGYTHALQIDADGQHNIADAARFVDAATAYPRALICGEPVFDETVPSLRFYARYITLFFCRLETLSTEIHDAMCGFRLYPLAEILPIIEKANIGERMTFDPEILVRSMWAGISLHYIPIKVGYPEGGRSHFRYLRDNVGISWMHTRLLAGMLLRFPRIVMRIVAGRAEHRNR